MLVAMMEVMIVMMLVSEFQNHGTSRERSDQNNQRHRTPHGGAERADLISKTHRR